MRLRIFNVGHDELRWGFDAQPPHIQVRQPGGWTSHTSVDPCPAYGHDVRIARATLRRCEEVFPPLSRVYLSLLPFELTSRTNGHSEREYLRDTKRKRCPGGVIVLSGKRIPPHPAMTRYLVAHEYGHHVQWWIEHRRGMKPDDLEGLRGEYARMRRMKPVPYGPGQWHASVGEVFANDFRILVAGVEEEFWPHPGITRPEILPSVRRWWRKWGRP